MIGRVVWILIIVVIKNGSFLTNVTQYVNFRRGLTKRNFIRFHHYPSVFIPIYLILKVLNDYQLRPSVNVPPNNMRRKMKVLITLKGLLFEIFSVN